MVDCLNVGKSFHYAPPLKDENMKLFVSWAWLQYLYINIVFWIEINWKYINKAYSSRIEYKISLEFEIYPWRVWKTFKEFQGCSRILSWLWTQFGQLKKF